MSDQVTRGLPVVAIVGRPNVGKSALFNRLIGEPIAIVEDQPGVTRDRIYGECTWNGRTFQLVDTGGMVMDQEESLKRSVLAQARQAVGEAAVVLMVVDATSGIHGLEQDISDLLRRSNRPVLLVANKVDNSKREEEMLGEFYGLALGDPWPVSSLHGRGTGDLLDEVVGLLPAAEDTEQEEDIRIAIVGRPNVGKSSLLNAMLNEERAIVDAIPGTTRDAVDTVLHYNDRTYRIVDTAGMRKPARVDDKVEYYSTLRSQKAIKQCDIALLVLDATEGVHHQDKRVAGLVQEARRGIVVVINKWDLVSHEGPKQEADRRKALAESLQSEFNFMSWAPVVFTSAQKKTGIDGVFDVVHDVFAEFTRKLDAGSLTRLIQEATQMRPPPTFKGQQLRVFHVRQKSAKPPTFIFQVNSPKLLHFSYRRYLENHIRRAFGLMGTPIELILKKK